MDRVAFPYRSNSHLVLLHVVAESGAWEKYGLDVDYDRHISSNDAHHAVPAGEVEFVGGNHVSTYGHRARGDSWLYLKQHGLDSDRDDIEFINQTKLKKNSMDAEDPAARAKLPPTWQWVRDGIADAALLGPPASLFAKAAGLKVIDIEPLPMIQFTTVSS